MGTDKNIKLHIVTDIKKSILNRTRRRSNQSHFKMTGQKTWIFMVILISLFSIFFVKSNESEDDALSPEQEEELAKLAEQAKTASEAGEVVEEEDVLVLTDKNFDDVISKHKIIL